MVGDIFLTDRQGWLNCSEEVLWITQLLKHLVILLYLNIKSTFLKCSKSLKVKVLNSSEVRIYKMAFIGRCRVLLPVGC